MVKDFENYATTKNAERCTKKLGALFRLFLIESVGIVCVYIFILFNIDLISGVNDMESQAYVKSVFKHKSITMAEYTHVWIALIDELEHRKSIALTKNNTK